MSTIVGAIGINAILNSDDFQRGLKQLEKDGNSTGASLANIGKAANKAFVALGVKLKTTGIAALKVGGELERSMLQIQATTGMSTESIDGLGMSIRDMALGGNFSARKIADALSGVAVAGMDAEEATRLMEYSMTLALATSNDLGKATDFLALALMKAGTDTRDAERYINAFTQTIALSGMALSNLEKAIITLAPTMNMTGASIEKMSGALAVLYRGGIAGVAAGRGLEQIVNSLISPTDAAADAMSRLNINMFDPNTGEMRNFNDVLLDTMDALEGVEDAQERYNLQNNLFSTVYARAVFNELQTNRDAWQENIGMMYEATGAIDGTGIAFQNAATNTSGFLQQLGMFPAIGAEMLKIIFDIINAPLGEKLSTMAEAARDLVERMREGGDLHPYVQRLGEAITNLITVVGNVITALVPLVVQWLPTLAAVFTTVLNVAIRLAPALLAIYAALKAWKIVGVVVGLVNALVAANTKFAAITAKTQVSLHGKKVALGLLGKVIAAYNSKLVLGQILLGRYAIATKAAAAGKGILTKALTAVKSGFIKLTAAMLANPIGLVVGAVGLLVAGTIALVSVIGNARTEQQLWNEETQAMVDTHREFRQELQYSREAFAANMEAIAQSAEHYDGLIDKILELSSAYELTDGDLQRLKGHIDDLNARIPGLNLLFDEQTHSLNMTGEALREQNGLIDAQNVLNEIRARKSKHIDERRDAESKLNEALERQTEAQQRLRDALGESGQVSRANAAAVAAARTGLEYATTAVEYARAAIDELDVEIQELNYTWDEHSALLANNRRQQEEQTRAAAEARLEIERQTAGYRGLVDALGDVGAAFDRHYDTATAALRGAGGAALESAADIITSMRESGQALLESRELFAMLNDIVADSEFSDEFVAHLRKMVTENPIALRDILENSDRYLGELYEVYNENIGKAVDVAIEQHDLSPLLDEVNGVIGDIRHLIESDSSMADALAAQSPQMRQAFGDAIRAQGFGQVADYIADGLINRLQLRQRDVARAFAEFGAAGHGGLTDFLQMRSPSRLMMDAADDVADGFIIQSENRFADIANLGTELGENFTDGVVDGVSEGFKDIGAVKEAGIENLYDGLIGATKENNARLLQAEAAGIDEQIRQIEQSQRKISHARDLEARQRAVAEAQDGEARLRAQQQLNDLLTRNELEALRERRDAIQREMQHIERAFNEMSQALTSALRNMHQASRDASLDALRTEHDTARDLLSRQVEARQDSINRQVDAIREGTRQAIELYQREFDVRMSLLNAEEAGIIGDLQGQIDALDAMTQAEDRAVQAQENARRLADLQTRIAEAETYEDRLRAQEAFNTEFERQQRQALLQSRRDQQQALRHQIAEVRANYAQQRDMAREQHQAQVNAAREAEAAQLEHLSTMGRHLQDDYRARQEALARHLRNEQQAIERHYDALKTREALEAQARALMIDNNQQEIIRILNSYLPDWATAGMSAGQQFLAALQGVTPSIEGEVHRIMGLINQAQQATQQLHSVGNHVVTHSHSPQPSTPSMPARQTEPQIYTVQPGDTLYGIARQFGITVSALRNENELRPEDDRRLPIGRVLRIPILHEGGVSLKEQLALIDKHEAVAPLATLSRMIETAVSSAYSKMSSSLSRITNNSSSTTTHKAYPIEQHIHYSGNGDYEDVRGFSRQSADEFRKALRSRGIPVLGVT